MKKTRAENRTNRAEKRTNRAENPGIHFFNIFEACFLDLNSLFVNQFPVKECAVWSVEVLAKQLFKMSFCSKAWSSETLSRGLNLVASAAMTSIADPDPAELQAELDRLLVTWRSIISGLLWGEEMYAS